jgi:sugar-specific transcriptional regulator TrmB
MGNIEDDVNTLMKLGLNRLQARAYLTLLKLGPEKAKEIAKAANIARPDIYRTLSKLLEVGLIEKIVATPAVFKAIPIADALTILFRRREMENDGIRRDARDMHMRYREADKLISTQKEDQFVLIPKREPIIINIQKLAEASKKSICMMIPLQKLLPLMISYSRIFSRALANGISVQIITDTSDNKQLLLQKISKLDKNPNFELRLVSAQLTVHFSIFDCEKILLSTAASARLAEAPSIFSNNLDIIGLAKQVFDIEWVTAMETKHKEHDNTKQRKK